MAFSPKILMIGGGWHTPSSYGKLTKQLQDAGYDVHVPALPSTNGSRPPNADLASDTKQIRSAAQDLVDKGYQVVALMHSYGGQVGTNALYELGLEHRKSKGLHGGISHLIFLTAYASPEGKAMIDAVKHFGHEELMPLAFDFADDMTVVSRDPKTLLVGETELAAADLDDYVGRFVRWNGQAMYQPLDTTRAAWRDIPVTYIHTTKDMTIPYDYQKWFVEEMRKEGVEVKTASLDTGHCANFTATKEVVEVVDQVVKGTLRSESAAEAQGVGKDVVKDTILDVKSKS